MCVCIRLDQVPGTSVSVFTVMMMMMMFTYIDFIHNKKLENYAPCVKYRPSKKRNTKKKATNNTIKVNK
jgi:hypothetical protein